MTPETCPNCGADVPTRARACPECGADEQTGWSDDARSDGLGLPDDSFNYEDFVDREFGGGKGRHARKKGGTLLWKVVAGLLVGTMLFLLLRHWFPS